MKRALRILGTLAAIWVSLFSISCKYDLISEPSIISNSEKSPSDYPDAITPPLAPLASQGTYRSIKLTWDEVPGAVQYQIFAATTPFDTFEQIAETENEKPEIILDYPSGMTIYFQIASVNYYGTVSARSTTFHGSTLSIPVITEITPSADSQSVSVSWWMDNCDETTYTNNIQFLISAFDSKKKLITGSQRTTYNSTRSVNIEGLAPKTDYYFQIEAILLDENGNRADQKTEKSDLTSAATTHSIVPKAVKELSASQGTNDSYIEISWKLPEGADYFDSATNTYPIHPIIFDLQRRDLSKANSEFSSIAKIGAEGVAKHFTTLGYTFNCETGTTSSANLKISVSGTALENYPTYKADSTITFRDTQADRTGKYSYRVISYTDNLSKVVTHSTSISSEIAGWKIGFPELKITKDYVTSDNVNINQFIVSFSFTYDSKGKNDYMYILAENSTIITVTNSISELNNYVRRIDVSDDTLNSYEYVLYITLNSPNISDAIISQKAIGNVNVVKTIADLAPIEFLDIIDGYKDKFRVYWNYNSGYSYKITKHNFADDITTTYTDTIIDLSIDENKSKIVVDNGLAYFDIPLLENTSLDGEIDKFSIQAYSNNIATGEPVSTENKFYSLGTPVITMSDPDYTSINIQWKKVQNAENDYFITAHYENTLNELITPENFTKTETNNGILYTLNKPEGFDNPLLSGKNIEISITARNNKTQDATTGTKIVRTLGPALLKPETANPSADTLTLHWTQVEGAKKYLVYRTLYSDKTKTTIESSDTFIIEGSTITNTSGQDTTNRTTVSLNNGIYELIDRQQDKSENYVYFENQSKIQWGKPYGYIVLPLKEDGTKDTFKFNENTLTITNDSKVNYGTLNATITSTFGYGLNVTASKSESASAVTVKWDAPNDKNYVPTLYRKRFSNVVGNDYGANWEIVKELSEGITSYEDKLSKSDWGKAFVYAVQYQAPTTSNFVKSYREKLDSVFDTQNSPTETLNKGYLLALDSFNARYGGTGTSPGNENYYRENVNWVNWNYEERALGPDFFTIDIKNKNLSSTKDWTTVANVTITNNIPSITTVGTHTDTKIERQDSNNGIYLKPIGLSNGTLQSTNGLLHVLRDAKHYYSINLSRNGKKYRQAEDESIYAYRQISEEEAIKIALLLYTDGMNRIGKLDFNSEFYPDISLPNKYNGLKFDGSISFTHKDQTSKEYTFSYIDYSPVLETPTGDTVQNFIISCEGKCYRTLGTQGGYPIKFDKTDITLKPLTTELNSSSFDSYYKTVTYSINDYKTANVKCGKTEINITNEHTRRQYIPLKMCISQNILESTNENWYHESTDYGWWN